MSRTIPILAAVVLLYSGFWMGWRLWSAADTMPPTLHNPEQRAKVRTVVHVSAVLFVATSIGFWWLAFGPKRKSVMVLDDRSAAAPPADMP